MPGTLVTITPDTIRAYNHSSKTGVCIAVSAVMQTAARILDAGKALDHARLEFEPPVYEVRAAIGDFAGDDVPADERMLIARQRAGRQAFVQAVLDGVAATLGEIEAQSPLALEVHDQRANAFADVPRSESLAMQPVAREIVTAG